MTSFPGAAPGKARAADPAGRERLVLCLLRAAEGERAALRDIYDLTAAKLLGVCLRILHDREEAEDVLQDVYLTIWNKAGHFDAARASPITWMATIARNRSIDRLRSLGSRARTADIDLAAAVPDGAPDALGRLEAADEARRLRDCLDGLDERARGTITAAFFGGHTYEALALREDMPLGTVKSIVRRGLIRLKGCLEA